MNGIRGKNYYEILGVERDATKEVIREAYREIARVYHPDSNFYDEIVDESMSEEQMQFFQLITDAYNTLSNEQKRSAYDETLPKGLKDWEDSARQQQSAEMLNNNSAKPVRNSGRYVFGEIRRASVLENAFAGDVRPVSEMMYSKKYQKRQKFILVFAVMMPIVAFGILLYVFFTR